MKKKKLRKRVKKLRIMLEEREGAFRNVVKEFQELYRAHGDMQSAYHELHEKYNALRANTVDAHPIPSEPEPEPEQELPDSEWDKVKKKLSHRE